MSNVKFSWKCPKCGADADKCSPALKKKGTAHQHCMGFICECDPSACPASEEENHGISLENPCENASCYCCGWGGKYPAPPKGLQTWEKKALEAGWTMPEKRKKELGL